MALAWLGLSTLKPQYTAEALIKIEHVDRAVSSQGLAHASNLDKADILSEVQVIKSSVIARSVIQKYGLVSDPELNPLLQRKQSSEERATTEQNALQNQKFKSLSLETKTTSRSLNKQSFEVTDRIMNRIIHNFQKRVQVSQVAGSYVIKVEYTSASPEKAAKITSAIIDTYLDKPFEKELQTSENFADWLETRLATLQDQVRLSEEAVEAYRRERNLVIVTDDDIETQNVSALNAQLAVATAEHDQAVLRLARVEAGSEVNSNLVTQLKIRESDLQTELSALSKRYGRKHPLIINARGELKQLQNRIDDEIKISIKDVEREIEIAKEQMDLIQSNLDELEVERGQKNQDLVRLDELMREAETNRLIYEQFLETNKVSGQQKQLLKPAAQIISYATVPSIPSYPNKSLFMGVAAAAALFFATLVCLLLEKFDHVFRSATQIEHETGYPCFAMIPKMERMSKKDLADFIVTKPASSLAESVRTLRTVLKIRSGTEGEGARVLAITSSFPREGKTTLACWLARIAAKSGEKVIIIDGDLRRPAVDKMLEGKGSKTIVEYLTGRAKLENIIEKDTQTGLHKIYARSVPNSALDLIDSDKMKNLIGSLRQVYDLVIIDTPASLAVSDASVLALLSDYALYCVHWNKTSRKAVAAGMKKLTDMGHENVAFALTNIDISKYAKYGYGDTPNFHNHYNDYYQN